MYQLKNFDPAAFLQQYWQKKPLLIKQAFSQFVDPLDEHELAGLALEDEIDSRIISHHQGKWQVAHGPFDDINKHCLGAWSLLVQGVDHHCSEGDQLMRAFSFLPHWRMSDLMVSFSNAEAGVGAHIDQYDVFIIQGKGSRRWQVGLPGDYTAVTPHPDLKQIDSFSPVIDEVLMPGDMIYIPPHHPHKGVALDYCMNYSVGFRAPSQQELLSGLADYALEHNLFTQRYSDQDIQPRHYAGEIKQQEVSQFKQLLQQTLDSADFAPWLANFLSQSNRLNIQELAPDEAYSEREIDQLLAEQCHFIRESGVKPVFLEAQQSENNQVIFYIQGNAFACPANQAELLKNLLNGDSFCANDKNFPQNSLFFTQLLTKLVNSGYWFPE